MNTPAGDATGVKEPASRFRYSLEYTFCLDNGGSSGMGYSHLGFTLQFRGPFSAGVLAVISADAALWAAVSARTRPHRGC